MDKKKGLGTAFHNISSHPCHRDAEEDPHSVPPAQTSQRLANNHTAVANSGHKMVG